MNYGRSSLTNAYIISPKIYGYGALLIAGIMENHGVNIAVKKGLPPARHLNQRIIGISFQSVSDILNCKTAIEEVKSKADVFIVVGGPITIMPEIVAYHLPCVDLIVVGEGEETIVEFLQRFPNRQNFEDLEGVAFLRQGVLVKTNRRKPASLEGRPFPKIPNDLPSQVIRGSNIYLETHRGCIEQCTFCLVPRLFGKKVRSRPIDEIVEEAKFLKSAGVSRIAISGGTASLYGYEGGTVNERAFSNLLYKLSKVVGRRNLTAADLRVDLVTTNVLESIKKFTTGIVAFGIESGSEKVLRSICKGFTLSDVYKAVAQAKKRGLEIIGSFITGHPSEEEEDFKATLDAIRSLELHNYAINIADPIPGTPMFNEILHLNSRKNPLYQIHGEKVEGRRLTISEFRALRLWEEAYRTKFRKKCPRNVFQQFLRTVQSERQRIVRVIRACSFLKNSNS